MLLPKPCSTMKRRPPLARRDAFRHAHHAGEAEIAQPEVDALFQTHPPPRRIVVPGFVRESGRFGDIARRDTPCERSMPKYRLRNPTEADYLCLVMATATETTAASAASSDGLIDVRLTDIRFAAQDTNLYEFRRGWTVQPLPAYEPGAHIDMHLPNGMVAAIFADRPRPEPRKLRRSASSATRRAAAARATSTTNCTSARR